MSRPFIPNLLLHYFRKFKPDDPILVTGRELKEYLEDYAQEIRRRIEENYAEELREKSKKLKARY